MKTSPTQCFLGMPEARAASVHRFGKDLLGTALVCETHKIINLLLLVCDAWEDRAVHCVGTQTAVMGLPKRPRFGRE